MDAKDITMLVLVCTLVAVMYGSWRAARLPGYGTRSLANRDEAKSSSSTQSTTEFLARWYPTLSDDERAERQARLREKHQG